MGKLSNAKCLTDIERYSVEGMLQNEMSVEAIAKALQREESLVADYVNGISQEEETQKDLLVRKTKSGKSGVTVMTQAASQKSDSQEKEGTPETTGKSRYIHRTNNDNG
tara:strand:- start:41524 stop:41850 length:327 start_codon:yes stop_codon:yes gene_type:complete